MIASLLFFIAFFAALGSTAVFLYGAAELISRHYPGRARIAPTASTNAAPPTRNDALRTRLQSLIKGDAVDDAQTIAQMSRDTSVFSLVPQVVVYPKDAEDVSALVREIAAQKKAGKDVSITGRSAGTDMSGGPLTRSVVAVFTKYMNKILFVGNGFATTEPGVYYRDFEKATLAHGRQLLPSYPASREIAAMGGIVNNNSGGERSLEYGKTENYIEEVEVVLSDGSRTVFKDLSPSELAHKKQQKDFEGEIYRKMDDLLTTHAAAIAAAKPKVSKNSAGYALWNVKGADGSFNLAKLVCGAQGTLALMTKAKLRLVKDEPERSMLVAFLSEKDMAKLPEIVAAVLPHNPESFESFDKHTLSLAIRFLPQMLGRLGLAHAIRLGFSFLPEVGMTITGGLPYLILMAEFSEQTHEAALRAAQAAHASLAPFNLRSYVLKDQRASEKYWIVRRESFALLRKHSHNRYAAPFIDDFVVPPSSYPKFLPELDALLAQYDKYFIYTVAGHIGNGNFHIIPLMDLRKPEVRAVILELAPKVYDLVIKHGGTTTGEHNDGIIRTPYLRKLFGREMYALFRETKAIFDPLNIFNPGKKVGGTFEDIKHDMITTAS